MLELLKAINFASHFNPVNIPESLPPNKHTHTLSPHPEVCVCMMEVLMDWGAGENAPVERGRGQDPR